MVWCGVVLCSGSCGGSCGGRCSCSVVECNVIECSGFNVVECSVVSIYIYIYMV